MAVTLLNGYVALKNPEPTKGLVQGTVVMVAADVTDVTQNDKVFYEKGMGIAMNGGPVELILIRATELVAKQ